ncbi:MAG TPA: HigA family addiction module antitoxin [Longimicrobium sp.]|uniref:HigA family addiction module antitoxin n=1 Tax=Longimicrobium sp. TaxID=2029185 RepID=UPI002ED8148C
MTRLPKTLPPVHPGEMLMEEFIRPHGLSLAETARRLRISYQRLHEIVHGKRGASTDTALRFEALFGMEAEFWLNLQRDWDLWHALHSPLADELKEIPALAAA